MKAVAVLAPLALMAVQPAQADVGRGISLAFEFFGLGIADLFKEVFSKRDGVPPVFTKRQGPPAGVPEFEFERCKTDIAGLTITASSPAANVIQFSGVPATCMNLANVLVGDGTGPFALPCGSDCLSYSDLTPEQFAELEAALDSVA
ncbi:uncharacterized protein ColSpa_07945 [Colletotrichum spaethianum]|uniref:Uncharacterized protein n=1 Tax=Colletotrichum spaethianum TaxID=700344 RepID=A0AA37P8T9_9PEZI|nr:uncharacterized protein ColSpa_07945 [Colletotrichum spaethianum]GKT47764.1 hypothetical protein ColSpa_07945 [Colletotrichum spaethianum]